MIPLITYICLTFYPPPEGIMSDTPWHEQRIELIDAEPTIQDIEWEIRARELREVFKRLEDQK